ncbi:MAG TPA: ABC transporter ATP-binding protein [Nitrospiria bacterium]|nr:ABC transporter ATP-binding protein [Nitrospiria bacterium]
MPPSILVSHLGKRYRIGAREPAYRSLREAVAGAATAPFRRLVRWSRAAESEELIWALHDVSFDVQAGEVIGVIGRNGAGKSTLLKIMSRITEPTEGRVVLRGRAASLLEVGTGFHPELTGRENVYLNGTILGMKRKEIDRKFDEIIAFSEIEPFLDTPVKHYSSGMYVRLAFAVAAHLDPEILLVDEVLAVGDAGFQKKCLGRMGEVAREGRTVLFVSHNMAAVEHLCPRTIWIGGGRLLEDARTVSVINNYYKAMVDLTRHSLTARNDRTGSNAARITSLEIRNASGPADAIRCSHRLSLRLCYESASQVQRYAALFSILDSRGVAVYWLDSRYEPGLPPVLPAVGVISCTTGPVNLIPGVYSVNAALKVQGDVADQIESGASFTVEPEDYYGVGQLPDRQHGICLLPQSWQARGRS